MDVYSSIANNIKYYRNKYGESQQDLAIKINTSASTIGSYETKGRRPPLEVIVKIASHFGITIDELIYADHSNKNAKREKKEFASISASSFIDFILTFIPIISTENALNNTHFKKGYLSHQKILKGIKEMNYGYFTEGDLDICMESYQESMKENIPEAIANLISLIMICCPNPNSEFSISNIKNLSFLEIQQKTLLKDIDNDQVYYSNIIAPDDEKELLDLIGKLHSYSEYQDLSNYFAAIRYSFGLINNNFSLEMNRTIGNQMLLAQFDINNKFVVNTIAPKFDEII
jgi:transcriptional regulator with XRE-family HTH domain